MSFAPLPEQPTFSVYGISGTGWFRWVELWQRTGGNFDGPLSEVILGHQDDSGNRVFVTTEHKIAPIMNEDGTRQHPPVEFYDLCGSVLLGMMVRERRRVEGNPTFGPDFNQRYDELAGNVREPNWRPGELAVDGAATRFWLTDYGHGRAAVSDLGSTVAVGMAGSEVDLTAMSLRSVNDMLDSYETDSGVGLGRPGGRSRRR